VTSASLHDRPDIDAVAAELEARLPGRVARDASIAELTTYRLGGPVAVLVRVGTDAALVEVAAVVRARRPPLLILGRGSNLLVADAGFAGLGLVLDGVFDAVELRDDRVWAGGAVPLPVLARRSAAAGRSGLEFLVGIPGTVGGGVRMNAGGHGRETREVLERAWVVDLLGTGSAVERTAASLELSYRCSALTRSEIVTAAEFAVNVDDVAACEERVAEIVRWRREHQPGGANAGSVFRNPLGDSAGRLVDACGLKGLRRGGAVVSPKHANFVQAGPGATAGDVRELVLEVQRRVEDATGVRLVPELGMVGFAGDEGQGA
jgi:UDP-N-acetylmuramate dehydrogenase